mmetsp:Transcript_22397/g.62103  ORF Transcript_22397/g.62103 Transcript_22397/m.62103 type:complete len:204 (+) Transcript_22397:2-613(+)
MDVLQCSNRMAGPAICAAQTLFQNHVQMNTCLQRVVGCYCHGLHPWKRMAGRTMAHYITCYGLQLSETNLREPNRRAADRLTHSSGLIMGAIDGLPTGIIVKRVDEVRGVGRRIVVEPFEPGVHWVLLHPPQLVGPGPVAQELLLLEVAAALALNGRNGLPGSQNCRGRGPADGLSSKSRTESGEGGGGEESHGSLIHKIFLR